MKNERSKPSVDGVERVTDAMGGPQCALQCGGTLDSLDTIYDFEGVKV